MNLDTLTRISKPELISLIQQLAERVRNTPAKPELAPLKKLLLKAVDLAIPPAR